MSRAGGRGQPPRQRHQDIIDRPDRIRSAHDPRAQPGLQGKNDQAWTTVTGLSSGFNSKLQLLHFTANFLSYSWKFPKNEQVLTVKGQVFLLGDTSETPKWPLLMCVTHGLCKRHPISAPVTALKHVRACFILFKGEKGRSMCHLCVSWACNSENNHVMRINIKYTAVIAQKNHLILRGSDQKRWLLLFFILGWTLKWLG